MKAKLNVLIAMVTFGTVSIFVKNIPLSTGEISLYRASIGFLVILLYQLFSGNRIKISEIKQDLPLLFISGICIGFGWYCSSGLQVYHCFPGNLESLLCASASHHPKCNNLWKNYH